jgi:hypothetical protein
MPSTNASPRLVAHEGLAPCEAIARPSRRDPDPAELAAVWVARRYRVSPFMAAAIAGNAGLGRQVR